jgi:predicted ArsR family transcriptional regulator
MSRIKTVIIGLLMLLTGPFLTGCSALRLGYANGPTLGWIWIDGYFDFSRAQSPEVKRRLDTWFAWHRATQLNDYAALLASAQGDVAESTTPAATCRWAERIRDQLEPALQRAVAEFAEVVPALGDAQLRHLEQRYAKIIGDMRDDYLQPDRADRERESFKRAEDRAEQLYGSLDEAQLRVIRSGVAASPFNPDLWLVERQRRQRDVLQTLRKLQADKADLAQRITALRGLVDRTERSPNAEYRAYQVKLTDYNCAFAAQIHNATTPAQRQKARERLKGWEDDVRSLSSGTPG